MVKCYFYTLPFQSTSTTKRFTQIGAFCFVVVWFGFAFYMSCCLMDKLCRMQASATFLKSPATNSYSFGLAKLKPMQACLAKMQVS